MIKEFNINKKYILDIDGVIEKLGFGGDVWGIENETFREIWEEYNNEETKISFVRRATEYRKQASSIIISSLGVTEQVYIYFEDSIDGDTKTSFYYYLTELASFFTEKTQYVQEEMEI